ncbi:hypothetical protein BsWGS_15828 [Bradybaena similaris]
MPAVLHSGDPEHVLPPGLTSLDIKSLTSCTDLVNKYVQATVHHRYQHCSVPVSSLKCILQDIQGSTIELMAFGQVADDLDICVKGDVLIFLKFEVEASPGHCSKPYQMIVDDTGDIGSLVWIFKNRIRSTQARPSQTATALRSYSYKSLGELKVNTIVDVYGVVKFYKPPVKTRGSDFCCVIGLTDPSLSSSEDKVSCNIFAATEAQLPQLQVGYIIRLHRLKIQTYNGRKQGYNGPGFQWLVFRGTFDDQEALSSSYTIEQQDEDKVNNLLDWWQEHGALASTRTTKMLSEVQPKEYFNLICQVVRICDLEANPCKVLRVWDGSKFQGVLKMTAEVEFNYSVLEDGTLMQASAGLAVDVYLFDNHQRTAGSIKPGNFIQLTNLHAAVVSGRVELTLHGGTAFERGVEVLSTDSPQVRHLNTLLASIVDGMATCNLLRKETNADKGACKNDVSSKKSINTSSNEKTNETTTNMSTTILSDCSSGDKHIMLDNNNAGIHCNYKSDHLKAVKRQSVDSFERNYLTDTADKQILVLDTHKHHLEAVGKKRMKTSHVHDIPNAEDPLEVSSDGDQSLWFSAYDDSDAELQLNKGLARKGHHHQLQYSSISSSGASIDDQCLQSSQPQHKETSSDLLSEQDSDELNKSPEQLSQDSFHTVSSTKSEGAVKITVIQASKSETGPTPKTFLSLKSKPDTYERIDNGHQLFTQERNDDGHQPSTLSSNDVLSLTSSILYFDTAQFTETDSAVNAQQAEVFKESEVSKCPVSLSSQIWTANSFVASRARDKLICQESETQPRCMLKTASTVIGHHTHVPESSLKNVLERGVCQKFKVLVRVQDMTPWPISPRKLVNFICSLCGHIESAESLTAQLNTLLPEHVCPASVTHCQQLKPVIVVTFILTDGQDSLTAYLWDNHAAQLLCGIQPLELLSNAECFNFVQEKLESLCPHGSRLDERPLLECCLFSYGTEASVKYQIFDTVLV